MHELLLAETTFLRLNDRHSGINYVTVNSNGELKKDGVPVTESELHINMLRLDLELFVTGQVALINRVIDRAESFEFVQTSAAGLDNPMFRTIAGKTEVFCNSDAQSASIAEFVVASVLNRWHRFDVRREHQRAREWKENIFKQVLGSNWLIIGYGNIGQRIARQVKGMEGYVTGVKRDLSPQEHADQLVSLEKVPECLPQSDVVVLSCPLNDQTRLLADAAFLSRMKPDAVLVNIGRGLLVDEDALISALDEGRLDFAVLDVFQTEPLPETSVFWTHERVQVTPHASHRGSKTDERFDALFQENLNQYLSGGPVRNQVMPGSF